MFKASFDIQHNCVHIISLSCNTVPPLKYGGIELVAANLCEGLTKFGAKVKCYSPGKLDIPGVEHCQTLKLPSTLYQDGGVPNTLEHLESISRMLKLHLKKGDVVIFNHKDHYHFLKRRLGLFNWRKANYYEIAHWIDVGMRKNIIYPSQHLKNEIGKPGTVIPHGEKLLFNETKNPRENYLFFAGRITKDKGIDIALTACKKMNIKLVLAGPLNDKAYADTIIYDDTVKYLGELTYSQLFEYYCNCKAMVYMTQYTEPFGLSVIEAMAAGAPVITTGKGGTGETVLVGETGFLAETAEQIADAYYMLDTLLPEKCVARAKLYSIARMAENYALLFTAQH